MSGLLRQSYICPLTVATDSLLVDCDAAASVRLLSVESDSILAPHTVMRRSSTTKQVTDRLKYELIPFPHPNKRQKPFFQCAAKKPPTVFLDTAGGIIHCISDTAVRDQNKGGQVSLALLSDVFGVSESYIARLFKVNKGSTVSEYVNGVKIAAACDRLTADHTPIGKISDSLGFYNAYYFSRVFKKIVGVTPSQFRRNAREIL